MPPPSATVNPPTTPTFHGRDAPIKITTGRMIPGLHLLPRGKVPLTDQQPQRRLRDLVRQWADDERQIRQGGGPQAADRQHAKGRLTARERIARLVDPAAPAGPQSKAQRDAPHALLELGLWAGYRMYDAWGGAPAAGVITAIGWIEGLPHMLVANDATVKAGAFFPATAKKVIRAQRIAYQNNLPLVYLVDSAGIFLPLQEDVFPDRDDFGRIFRHNSVLSAAGIPQIAAVMGFCVAGGSYLPVLCDKLLMTDGSGLYLAGPALVKSAIGQQVSSDELGGAEMHASVSGTVDYREPDDPACLDRIRRLVTARGETPGPAASSFHPVPSEDRLGDPTRIYDLVDADTAPWQILFESVLDRNSFQRLAQSNDQVHCGTARIAGSEIGIIASRIRPTHRVPHETGTRTSNALQEMAEFITVCDQQSLPLVFVQDDLPSDPTRNLADDGSGRAAFVRALAACRVPRLTLIVGGEFGAGSRTLCGRAFDPRFIFAWPNARFQVLDPVTPDQHPPTTTTDRGDVRHGAARGWVDAIIDPAETRAILITALSIARRRSEELPARSPRV